MPVPAATRFVLCVPDLDLSFYWTRFRVQARLRVAAAGFRLEDLPVRSTTHQRDVLAALALGPGDVLALRPLERDQPALLPYVERLHAAGVRVLLLGDLAGVPSDVVHAQVQSDHGEGLARAASLLADGRAVRALLLGETPHARVDADALRAHAPEVTHLMLAVPCGGSAPDALRAHGQAQTTALLAAGALGDGDLVLAMEDALALGALDALEAAGPGAPRLAVAGIGAAPDSLRAVREGRLALTLFFDPGAWLDALLAALDAAPGARMRLHADMVDAANLDAFQVAHATCLVATLEETVNQVRAARRDAAFLDAVVENMPAMLFVKRLPDLRFEYVNRERERWLGMPRALILGRTVHDFDPRAAAALDTLRDHEALASGAIVDQPVTAVQRAGGDTRYVLTRRIPLLDPNGQPSHMIGISLDVTGRELAEQALARRQQELEAAHQALEENQDKLLIAEKMAALGRLTAGIAHEMNTPLAAIRAALAELDALVAEYADSVGDADVTADDHRQIAAEMRQSAALATRSAQRAAAFVRSIKHHTRQQGNEERVRFAVVPALEESILLLDHQLKRQRCAVRLDAPDPALAVTGTPDGLGQVVTNLLTNAVDAGAHAIVVRAAGSKDGVELAVQDDGGGIAPADLRRIFEPMFTTKPFGQGTGLGLAIVHAIVVEQFGGRIDVASTPGAGTCVTLHFPHPGEGL
jgi:PAS domain S-box-containing protein